MTKLFKYPVIFLVLLVIALQYQFFLFGKVPIPADTLVGAYFPWLDYKWGFQVGVAVKNPPISDVFSQFFVWKYLIVDQMKQGFWPLWNPLAFSGTPILATYHSAALLPFNLLLLLPKYYGWAIFILTQTLAAALGMYFLAGFYSKNPVIKIAAACVFSLSGLMTTWLEFGTGVWAAGMLPWIFLSLEKYWQSKKVRFLYLQTISFLILFLAGHAQLTFYSSALFLIYLFYLFLNQKEKNKNMLFLPIFFWGLAVGMVMIVLLPAYYQTNVSVRGSEAYSKSFNFGLNPLYELIRLFAADFFGNPTTYNHWDIISYHEQSSFLGTMTLPLILPFILKRFRTRTISFWMAIFFISLFFANDNPVTRWFYSLPLPFLTYSSASRIFFITTFSSAILAVFALEKLQEVEEFRYFVRRSTVLVVSTLLAALLGFFIVSLIIYSLAPYKEIHDTINNFKVSGRNSIIPILLLLSLLILVQKRLFKKNWMVLILLLLYLDLGHFYLKYNPFVLQNIIFPKTPIHEFLQKQTGLFRIARADPEIMTPNTWIPYQLSSIEGYDPMALEDYARFFNLANGGKYTDGVSRYVELKNFPSPFVDALNTKYFLAVKRDGRKKIPGNLLNDKLRASDYKVVFVDKNSVVLENPHALERTYFIPKVTTYTSMTDLINRLNQPNFNPTKEAVIYTRDSISENLDNSGQVKITEYLPTKVTIEASSVNDSFLVLADSYEKGWKLSEDGKDKKYYEVNGALRGFLVPSGQHRYVFNYTPQGFTLGLSLTILSFAIYLLSSLFFKKNKKFY